MDDVLQNDDKAVKTLWCEQTVQACMIHSRYLMYVIYNHTVIGIRFRIFLTSANVCMTETYVIFLNLLARVTYSLVRVVRRMPGSSLETTTWYAIHMLTDT